MTIPEMKTIDRHIITNGMVVWDYDLDIVTVDLSKMTDPILSQFYCEPDPIGQYWFDVKTESGHRKTMSDTRVWLYHPMTGEKAEIK